MASGQPGFGEKSSRLLGALRRRDKRTGLPSLGEFRLWLLGEATQEGLWRCTYCQAFLGVSGLSIDHRDPLSLGGPTSVANLAVCCERCNRAKGALGEPEYRGLLALIKTWPLEMRVDIRRRLSQKPSFRSKARR